MRNKVTLADAVSVFYAGMYYTILSEGGGETLYQGYYSNLKYSPVYSMEIVLIQPADHRHVTIYVKEASNEDCA